MMMQEDEQKQFIQKAKEAYYKIGAIPCPAFGGELVYFNRHGWNHLIRKGRSVRDTEKQRKRMNLLKYVEYIIRRSVTASERRENCIGGYVAYFWALHRYVDGIPIRVIIRKLNNGRLHFFSIMDERNEKAP